MRDEEFATHVEEVRMRLYRTSLLYLGNESMALDAVDEAVYKAYRGVKKLRQPEYFNTWITKILLNVCRNELRREKHFIRMENLPETAQEEFDTLPLKEAVRSLPEDLREIVILRYFAGYTLAETAKTLGIAQGTAATRQRKALALLRLELGEEEER